MNGGLLHTIRVNEKMYATYSLLALLYMLGINSAEPIAEPGMMEYVMRNSITSL